jgi:hypothetical protein
MIRRVGAGWWATMGAALLLAGGACGPELDGDDVFPCNCGRVGPVDLLDVSSHVEAVSVGEHVLLWTPSLDHSQIDVLAVPRCGGDAITLAELEPHGIPSTLVGRAGDHIVRCDPETGAVDWLDPAGVAPAHRLFDAAWKCRLHPVAGGLAALDPRDDTILWHPDPADADAVARVVTEGARFVTPDWDFPPCAMAFDDCPLGLSLYPRLGPETAGDVLLVPTPDRTLVEVDVRTGAVSEPLAVGVEQVEVMSDPRYVRWYDVDEGDDHLLDRRTKTSTRIGGGLDSLEVERARVTERWAIRTQHSPSIVPAPAEPWTVLWARNLATGREHSISGRDGWYFVGTLGDDRLVVDIRPEPRGDLQRHVVDPASGELTLLDASGDAVAFGDDLLLYEPHAHNGDVGTMRLLSAHDQAVETLAEGVREDFLVTDHRRLVYVDFPALDMVGTLRVREPDGTWLELDHDVDRVLWPSTGVRPSTESTEAREIVYLALTGDRRVVRRTVLP